MSFRLNQSFYGKFIVVQHVMNFEKQKPYIESVHTKMIFTKAEWTGPIFDPHMFFRTCKAKMRSAIR